MTVPCRECENKGCGPYHSECEKYLQYKNELREANINKMRYMENGLYVSEAMHRMKRRRRST